MHRTNAKQMTLLFQAGCAVAAAGAVGSSIFGIPGFSNTPNIQTVSSDPQIHGSAFPGAESSSNDQSAAMDPSSRVVVDTRSVADRLGLLDNAPTPNEPDPIADDAGAEIQGTEQPEENDSDAIVKRVKYLGYMTEGENRLGFIRIDSVQRIVREGSVAKAGSDGLADLDVVAVRPNFIVLSDGEGRARISLATKTGSSIAMTGGNENVQSVPLREEDVVLTPEELESLSHLPPRQRAMQTRLLKRQKLGREIKAVDSTPLASFSASFSDPTQNTGVVRNENRREEPTRRNRAQQEEPERE